MAAFAACTSRHAHTVDADNIDIDTTGVLFAFYPHYNNIRFVCSGRPDTNDANIIFCCTAAFSKDYSITVSNEKICGAHVVDGTYHDGYRSSLTNGAFVFDSGHYRFFHDSLEARMREAGKSPGSSGFCQIRLDTAVVSIPSDNIWFECMGIRGYRNTAGRARISMTGFHYRALCEKDGRLCVIESKDKVTLTQFRTYLRDYGVSHALYLDTGIGWNYSWYRDNSGDIHELHPYIHPFNTNWIIFAK